MLGQFLGRAWLGMSSNPSALCHCFNLAAHQGSRRVISERDQAYPDLLQFAGRLTVYLYHGSSLVIPYYSPVLLY